MNTFQMESFMRLLGKNTVIRSMIPLGFKAGAPAVRAESGKVLLIVPFARYKTTGDVDKTLVFPAAYTATFEVFAPAEPSAALAKAMKADREIFPGKLVAFNTLSYLPECSGIDFGKPIGTFRHDAVKKYSKEEYIAQIRALYDAYDKVINAYLTQQAPATGDKMQLKSLLNELIVPAQKQMYRVLDEDFFNLYF